MGDSEIEEQQEEKKPGITTITVVSGKNKVCERTKGPDGRFMKNPRRMITTLEITRNLRRLLKMRVPVNNKKWGPATLSRFEALAMSMYDLAMDDSGDPKIQAARVAAYKELMLRAAGKPSVSDEEVSAMQSSGIKFVIIPPPKLMYPTPIDEKPEEKLKPSFIDAEIVEDKK